jgi:hypothetical protein
MKSIGEFFARVRTGHAKEIYRRTTAQSAVKKYSGVDIPVEQISFSGKSLVLEGLSQEAKSTLFVKTQAILAEASVGAGIALERLTLR